MSFWAACQATASSTFVAAAWFDGGGGKGGERVEQQDSTVGKERRKREAREIVFRHQFGRCDEGRNVWRAHDCDGTALVGFASSPREAVAATAAAVDRAIAASTAMRPEQQQRWSYRSANSSMLGQQQDQQTQRYTKGGAASATPTGSPHISSGATTS